ncbi:40S ribosomal protein S8 [Camelus dromedarius]|uniref:40S ribosomal protein S8 n=1 Tax=Camelus dromedarius TaxID=9838 RepID=A0A5N4C0Y3_CAMDR|nr:40S ribosomal protein S8 [Camelus dromedarius]
MPYCKKQNYELGCSSANIKIGLYHIHSREVVHSKTLVKNCIMLIDCTLYQQWYKSHYTLPLGHKKRAKLTPEEEEILNKKVIKENSEEI